jgi:hypothetical protein
MLELLIEHLIPLEARLEFERTGEQAIADHLDERRSRTPQGRAERERRADPRVLSADPREVVVLTTITEWIALHEADLTFSDITDRVRDEILELLGGESDDRWIWIRDITDTWAVYEDSGAGSTEPGLLPGRLHDRRRGRHARSSGPRCRSSDVTTYTPEPAEPAPTCRSRSSPTKPNAN